jgi:hypothetical protein
VNGSDFGTAGGNLPYFADGGTAAFPTSELEAEDTGFDFTSRFGARFFPSRRLMAHLPLGGPSTHW